LPENHLDKRLPKPDALLICGNCYNEEAGDIGLMFAGYLYTPAVIFFISLVFAGV
jgi:hypothetical protein